MPPCACSVRALEVFVRDLSGLTLRQPSTRRILTSKATPRPFSVVSRSQIVEPAQNHLVNDEFIPFELDRGEKQNPVSTSNTSIPPTSVTNAKKASEDHMSDEWHAEIEIVAPWPQETRHLNTGMVDVNQSVLGEGVEVPSDQLNQESTHEVQSADNASPQNDQRSLEHTENPSAQPVIQQETAPQSIPTTVPTLQRSRAENRVERKLRRMQQGTYRQEAEARRKALEADAVLKKIEALEDGYEGKTAAQDLDTEPAEPKTMRANPKPSRKNSTKEAATEISPTELTKAEPSSPTTPPVTSKTPQTQPKKEPWQTQKAALKSKFGAEGWQPRKRVSPDTLDGIRALHAADPTAYTTETLASHFKITPEAIRRILKSKWRPNEEEVEKRRVRWEKRGEVKWSAMAALGTRPPAKWRAKGIKTPQAKRERMQRRGGDEYVQWRDDRRSAGLRPSLSGRIL